MPYLVDGNNVMGQRVGWHRDQPGARRRLLDDVARFASTMRVSVKVVFDGAPEDHFPDGARYRGVQVFYAARGSDADTRIKAMVDASRERRTLLVVTSDRALADYVQRCGAPVVRAGDFLRRLDEAATATADDAAPRRASEQPSGESLNQWMRYFGVDSEDDE